LPDPTLRAGLCPAVFVPRENPRRFQHSAPGFSPSIRRKAQRPGGLDSVQPNAKLKTAAFRSPS
jgi:hypothetical protein